MSCPPYLLISIAGSKVCWEVNTLLPTAWYGWWGQGDSLIKHCKENYLLVIIRCPFFIHYYASLPFTGLSGFSFWTEILGWSQTGKLHRQSFILEIWSWQILIHHMFGCPFCIFSFNVGFVILLSWWVQSWFSTSL